jgi:hypothetical protein
MIELKIIAIVVKLDYRAFYVRIQVRSDSDFGLKFHIIQFYAIKHNSKSNRWIDLKFDMKILEVLVYVGVKFSMNRSLARTYDIGQNRLYKFCYLLPFDL